MKVIDKEALKKLIDDLTIEDIQITEPIQSIDGSTLQGKEHMHSREGGVKIIIAGRVNKPDDEL
jgi:hypothetical protein